MNKSHSEVIKEIWASLLDAEARIFPGERSRLEALALTEEQPSGSNSSMTIGKLASMIALLEGKKSQSRIGDVREVLALLVKLDAAHVKEHGAEDSPLAMLMARSAKKVVGYNYKKR